MDVRDAQPEEFGQIGELRVAAYQADGFLSETSTYADTLRVLGMDGTGEILAAVDGGHILGTVTLVNWPHGGEVLRAPGEGEVRALAVASTARGRGIGRALLAAVMRRAAVREVRELLLLTQPDMLRGPAPVRRGRVPAPAAPRLRIRPRPPAARLRHAHAPAG